MIEIRKGMIEGKTLSLYPKFLDVYRGRHYYEYRFYCVNCKKEWVDNSRWGHFEDVPEDAAFSMIQNQACSNQMNSFPKNYINVNH